MFTIQSDPALDRTPLTIEVSRAQLTNSETLRIMLEDIGDTDKFIPLPSISANVMLQIFDFFRYIEEPVAKKPVLPSLTEDLIKLILAANFLDIPELLTLLTSELADRIYRAKTPENIKNHVFNQSLTTFTLTQEQAILEKNIWLGTAPSGISFIH